jgi:hypothetical protein
MTDLKISRMIWFKGGLLLLIGVAAAVLLLVETPTLKSGLLLGLSIWGFCRAYYFAFYVIEHYLDPGYHFSGLWSFFGYLLRKKSAAARHSR